jgi:fructan beta-fructosidase
LTSPGAAADSFTFRVRTGVDVVYDIAANELNGHPLQPSPDGTLTLRLLADRGQLAIFAADGAYYECLNIDPGNDLLLTTDASLKLSSLSLHHLKSIWS